MNNEKIAVVGIGGRTATMLARELSRKYDVLAVGRTKDIERIASNKVYTQINGESGVYGGNTIDDINFKGGSNFDFLFLAAKNPVAPAIRYYFSRLNSEKIPVLVLSQNGISALEDARKALGQVLGFKASEVDIVRMVIFNPIEKIEKEDASYIKYSVPIRVAIAGSESSVDLKNILTGVGFEVSKYDNVGDVELSKLFLNLIGMASAKHGFGIKDGLNKEKIFFQEMGCLKEYIKIVKSAGRKFLNFPEYPVALFASIISLVPPKILYFFRQYIISTIVSKRSDKPKDLDEIDYYNGAVVALGKKFKIKTPFNEAVLEAK